MKTKLLRKLRKNYRILYKGYYSFETYKWPDWIEQWSCGDFSFVLHVYHDYLKKDIMEYRIKHNKFNKQYRQIL